MTRLQPPGRVLAAAVVLATLAFAASLARPSMLAQGAPVAANASEVVAQVEEVVTVTSDSLGIAPPQPIWVLTLRVTAVRDIGSLPAPVHVGESAKVYSRDPRVEALRSQVITAEVTLRGAAASERLWLTKVVLPRLPEVP